MNGSPPPGSTIASAAHIAESISPATTGQLSDVTRSASAVTEIAEEWTGVRRQDLVAQLSRVGFDRDVVHIDRVPDKSPIGISRDTLTSNDPTA